jgi:hypothetical protein
MDLESLAVTACDRTSPVRTDTGHSRHSLRECVCPVRYVRSHGLARHHRTLSALSAMSGVSASRLSSASFRQLLSSRNLFLVDIRSSAPAPCATWPLYPDQQSSSLLADGAIRIVISQLFVTECLRILRWEYHGKPGATQALLKRQSSPSNRFGPENLKIEGVPTLFWLGGYSTSHLPTRRRAGKLFWVAIGIPIARGTMRQDSARVTQAFAPASLV